jgi:hypothetical protein
MNIRRGTTSALIAGAAALILPSVALADTTPVGGTLNTSGALVQYSHFRTHTFNGPINMNITDNTATFTRLGLRDAAGVQFTQTTQWNGLGAQDFLTPAGGKVFPNGKQFAINGRMGACGGCFNNDWSGILTY